MTWDGQQERRGPGRRGGFGRSFFRRVSLGAVTLSLVSALVGVVAFGATDHERAVNAVPREVFNDTVHLIRASHTTDVQLMLAQIRNNNTLAAAVKAAVDSLRNQIQNMIADNRRAQIQDLCAAVKSTAEICRQ